VINNVRTSNTPHRGFVPHAQAARPTYRNLAPIAQSFALPGNAPDSAIGTFICLHGQKRIKHNSIAAGVSFYGYR
jgi:hypothetical protein